MTTIEMLFGRPGPDGTLRPVYGSLTWTPTKAHGFQADPDGIVLPLPLTVRVPVPDDEVADPFSIDIQPSGPGWAWKVEEQFNGLRRRRFYVSVPDVATVNYRDLTQVDPLTLEPSTAPVPEWYAHVDGLALAAEEARDAAVGAVDAAVASQSSAAVSAGSAATSATSAAGSASAADASEAEAGVSAFNAGTSAASALGHKNAAATSATNAGNSASAAAGSASAAAGSATAASTSAGSASTAKTGAEAARDVAAASAADALTRKNDAAASATSAQSSATSANNSANAASGSATSAASSASTAATKATLATTRAAEAAASAGTASTLANNAAGSATSAAGSAAGAASAKDQAIAAADGFSMGTVTTLNPGSSSTASITGTAPNRVINLGLARGDTGAKGDTGDLFTVAGPANTSGAFTVTEAMLASTRIWTLTNNVTITLATPVGTKSGTVTLVLTQDATGNRTIVWPSSSVLKWPEGIAQQPAPAANSLSMIHLMWTGTQWVAMLAGKSFA